ncbi:MAG: hypothetical protein LCH56_13720 [Proteobacteria bacterium]|nr:hypothetical protein [Pseudomonadota bacterium]
MPALNWSPRRILFTGVVAAILTMTLTVGVRLMNARVAERDAPARADDRRLEDLQRIADAAVEIYKKDGSLPQTLDDLQKKARNIRTADPESFEIYGYRVIDATKIEVCARLSEEHPGGVPGKDGRRCFEVTV